MASASEMYGDATPGPLSLDAVMKNWLYDPVTEGCFEAGRASNKINSEQPYKRLLWADGGYNKMLDRFYKWCLDSEFGKYSIDLSAVVTDYKSVCDVDCLTTFQLCSYVLSVVLNWVPDEYTDEVGLVVHPDQLMIYNSADDMRARCEELNTSPDCPSWFRASPTTGDEADKADEANEAKVSRVAADDALSAARVPAPAPADVDEKKEQPKRGGCAIS
jgi:hypothetical protein